MFRKIREGARDLASDPRLSRAERTLAGIAAALGTLAGLGAAAWLITRFGDDSDLMLDVAQAALVGALVLVLLAGAAVWHRRQGR
ncbi:hypothetical protein [Saccharothrix sp. HUAS TT1]|uniref:hypothetical protein n=1 Tax=unclassified Saccharothrix TaxID=2593673 RepID=UPI00345C4B45